MASSAIYETAFDEDVQDESNQCPECDGRVTTNVAETVCEECGLVLEDERIDHGPEWRSFSDDEQNRERTGAPLTATRHDRGLSTKIGNNVEAASGQFAGRKRRRLARMRREHSRSRFRSKAEQILAHGLGEIRRLTSALGLSKALGEQACSLFRSAQNEDILRGRSVEAMAAASVYGACRCLGLSRTLDDVASVARVAQSRVRSSYQAMNVELGLPAKPVEPTAFVPRLASALDVTDSIRQRARTLARAAQEAEVTVGVQPSGFAAACLYKACHKHGWLVSQREVAEVADSSPPTIRTHRDALDELDV
ncbi:transcription initiation factor IIB family protein [Halorussus limi]|uniref:Transcription initiation factor IIB family protein n=1 Tax=Halorussus limi TaxID=2938695 RepID=A0A8U0HWD3_9EURY|nr:transcription initiation factor IIB family protein [Halorussus limi]UPV75228.1 transcription initiation factor IIB family protein [Halorussus limi]